MFNVREFSDISYYINGLKDNENDIVIFTDAKKFAKYNCNNQNK